MNKNNPSSQHLCRAKRSMKELGLPEPAEEDLQAEVFLEQSLHSPEELQKHFNGVCWSSDTKRWIDLPNFILCQHPGNSCKSYSGRNGNS